MGGVGGMGDTKMRVGLLDADREGRVSEGQ
jgi:hypothetical protein